MIYEWEMVKMSRRLTRDFINLNMISRINPRLKNM